MDKNIMNLLPQDMQTSLAFVLSEDIEELRLRMGRVPTYYCGQVEYPFPKFPRQVCRDDFSYVLNAASHASLYAVNHEISSGYITVDGGHRIGLCGRVVMADGKIRTITDFSSMSIRLSADRQGIAPLLKQSTLIAGPPGSGKTTLLRDCVRRISNEARQRIVVVDERGELAACRQGIVQYDLGSQTDILTGCPKQLAVLLAVRTMSPQWIAVDEITEPEDVRAMEQASYCGVRFLASAHIWQRDDLLCRPVYRDLLATAVFQEALILTPEHHWKRERL